MKSDPTMNEIAGSDHDDAPIEHSHRPALHNGCGEAPMRHILGALSVCVFSVAIAAGARAQQSPTATPGGPQGGVQGVEFQHFRPEPAPPPGPGARPLFYFFGVPVVVNAPVMPPHCNCATETYA